MGSLLVNHCGRSVVGMVMVNFTIISPAYRDHTLFPHQFISFNLLVEVFNGHYPDARAANASFEILDRISTLIGSKFQV